MKCAGAVAVLLLVLPAAASAAGIDCRQAVAASERTICAIATLRAADTEMNALYDTVRAGLRTPLDAALRAGQRAWLRARDHDCTDAACLATHIEDRRAILAALAARVSGGNPTLPDLTAIWLDGAWQVDPPTPAGLQPAASLPWAGQTLTFRSGELCRGATCAAFGLEPQRLADGPGRDALPSLLGLPATSPFYLAIIDGAAAYGLVPGRDGTLTAISPACAPGGNPCGTVRQTWRPEPGATVHVGTAAAP